MSETLDVIKAQESFLNIDKLKDLEQDIKACLNFLAFKKPGCFQDCLFSFSPLAKKVIEQMTENDIKMRRLQS